MSAEPRQGDALKTVLGFGVHIFTATGAAFGLLALLAASKADWPLMFMLLGVALVVDGVDGAFARRLDVAERLPRWSGEILDLVVDFVTYVLVPAYALVVGGLLPQGVAVPLGIAIVMTGALYFADRRMKTTDNYFRGFPGVWNVPAFYLFLLRPDPWIAAALIAVLAVLTFAPVPFLHPFRVVRLRILNIALLVVWSVLAFVALIRDMMPGPWITGALCVIAVYFLGAGILRKDK
jgi:phosphatidylcholine synthase